MMHATQRPTSQLVLNGLGEVIRWAPLGPGGEPAMSLQGVGGLGELIRWGELGPGGFPAMSLQGLGQAQAEAAVTSPTIAAESAFRAGPLELSGKLVLPPWGAAAGVVVALGLGYLVGMQAKR